MKAQKIQLSVGMNKYMPLEIVTHTGNKGFIGSILSDGQVAMAIGFVYSKTHGKMPVAWNMYGESTDRVSALGLGDIKPTKDLCIKEIITKIPKEPKETDVFKQAFGAISKANGAESKAEKNHSIDTLPQEIQAHLSELFSKLGDGVEVKAYMVDSEGNLVSLDKPENETVH
jgi:hypothetical protein